MKLLTRLLQHLSISRLALLSVALTSLPMLAGMVSAYFAFERLSIESQYTVQIVAAETKTGSELIDRLNGLELKARKFSSLRTDGSFRDFELAYGQFRSWLSSFADDAKAQKVYFDEKSRKYYIFRIK